MAVVKCKMCGGNLEFTEGQSYGTCDSCGSTMTLPNTNDERIVNLFNRATHYRQQNEFDKAIATYESILEDDNQNAEAYWGLVLSKYGIEYVEDPKTNKRIPTCHRVQNESILADLDYKAALKHAADYNAEKLYEKEANEIAEIQKKILSVANSEEAYDIFICYKDTDNNGKRTKDSVIAQDIYSQLVNEGHRVFFSRITLEEKLGQEYEPYIFAALNSAKVMLVVGTKPEHFNAVWVKNEWSRFFALSKRDKSKVIIPCYRDMDAYELPEELAMFQSQDIAKLGFIQDLTRGINKILKKAPQDNNEKSHTTVVQQVYDYESETEALIKRAFILLEEAEWQKANNILEKALNINPENAVAYLGKLMIDVKVNKEENLAKRAILFEEYPSYVNALRFADSDLKERLERYKNAAKEKYNQLEQEKVDKAEAEKKHQQELEREFAELKMEYKQVKAESKKFVAKEYLIGSLIAIIIIILIVNTPMFDSTLFLILFVVLCTGGIPACFLFPLYYPNPYYGQMYKLKAKMILLQYESGEINLSENCKKIVDVMANGVPVSSAQSTLNYFNTKRICKKNGLETNANAINAIVKYYNEFNPCK